MDKAKLIEELLEYAKDNLDLKDLDVYYVRNILMRKFKVNQPYEGEIDIDAIKKMTRPDILNEELKKMAVEEGLCTESDADLYACEIMGDLSLLPSEFVSHFNALREEKGSQAALDWMYQYCIANNYVAKSAIDKNLVWEYKDKESGNRVEISINLSKPEKSTKDIAKAKTAVVTTYPKCLLCIENLGFAGGNGKAPRENIRIVPLMIDGNPWFMQYSPYGYFFHHAIIVNKKHTPMTITHQTFVNLLSFLDTFPTYFVGSNADLPIVGGSILAHEHYQGGLHRLPVYDSKVLFEVEHKSHPGVTISYMAWYNSVIRISGKDKQEIVEVADQIFEGWKKYSDPEVDIIANDGEPHSTVTPIALYENDQYNLYLILRNNRCNEAYPEGIFHAHQEYYNIKQENIGLIEAMGLFILPARLKRQFGEIEKLLSSDKESVEELIARSPDMEVHKKMIDELIAKYGRNNSPFKANEYVIDYVNKVCVGILKNTGVFKQDAKGQKALLKFLRSLDL